MQMPHPYFDVPRPTILGHRGAAGSAPENTLHSFERCLELGSHIIESDIHATRDGEPVMLHDPELDRISDRTGDIENFNRAELEEIDAAYHFTPYAGRSFQLLGKGIRIPTLRDAFERFPGARFNLEIKASPPGLVARIVELVREFEREARTLLTAGEDPIMRELLDELTRRDPRPAVGASTGDVLSFVRGALEGGTPPAHTQALQIPPDFAGHPLVTPQLVAFAHEHEVAVHVWTLNEKSEMQHILDLGCDGIVTDHPERMAELVAERG